MISKPLPKLSNLSLTKEEVGEKTQMASRWSYMAAFGINVRLDKRCACKCVFAMSLLDVIV